MIRNYFKIALRNLKSNRNYTVLSVLGLAVSIAACLLLFVVIKYETSFDGFHSKGDRIYRVVRTGKSVNGTMDYQPGSPLPMAAALKVEIPQFEKVVSVHGCIEPKITLTGAEQKKYFEKKEGLMVQPEFFDLFDFRWLSGSPKVLASPSNIVLSRKYADKYFGDWKSALGKTLRANNQVTLRVAGVLEDPPLNTDFPLNIVFSYETLRQNPSMVEYDREGFESWGNTSSSDQIFVLLPPKVSTAQMNPLLQKVADEHINRGKNSGYKVTPFLSPLKEQHYDKRFQNFSEHYMSRSVLWTLMAIGFMTLLVACINFVNLTTAQSMTRAREVGVRKALGSQRGQLWQQFYLETFLVVSISVLLGILLAQVCLPLMDKVSNVPASLPVLTDGWIWLFAIGLVFGVSFLAGLYPAMVLSGFKPIEALKSRAGQRSRGGISLQKFLIVSQFAVMQFLIVGTLVMVTQMSFIRNMDLGFAKDGVYVVNLDATTRQRFQAFKNEIEQLPGVKSISLAADVPASESFWSGTFYYENHSQPLDFNVFKKFADADYFKTFELKLVAGEIFPNPDSIIRGVVVNETLLSKLEIKDPKAALGKTVSFGDGKRIQITGVAKDFNTGPARDAIKPMVIFAGEYQYGLAAISLDSKNLQKSVASIKKAFDQIFPEIAYQGHFFEQDIQDFYEQEQQLTLLYQIFAGLSIVIACLGLFGLMAYMAQQRTKEIGIRKVLGASVESVVGLLSKEFLVLVVVAVVIASPLAYYFMGKWLEGFAYRIGIQWWVFVVSGLLALLVAMITVGFQAIKAALMNPVKSLRSE